MKRKTNIHRGQVLQTAVESSRLKKGEVAEKAGYSRASYYKHVQDPELDDHILAKYGKAIKYDFTEDIHDMAKYTLSEPEAAYGQPVTLADAIQQRDFWKDKYVDLLEKYNKLIEEKMRNRQQQ